MQLLLLPDPRPLVERLGAEFFRTAPSSPGVYLMLGQDDAVLYVGKARNLRRRLGSYRVANPDRLPRRHLRLLRSVARIKFELCPDEASALEREAELLRTLRPRYNRAGTWAGSPRFFLWRVNDGWLEISVSEQEDAGWRVVGPMGTGARFLREVLARVVWVAQNPHSPVSAMPSGWMKGRHGAITKLCIEDAEETVALLTDLFAGNAARFVAWATGRLGHRVHPFERALLDADLEWLSDYAARLGRAGLVTSSTTT